MMGIRLWRNGEVETGTSLVYLGEAVVLEHNNKGETTPHYFETEAKAQEFIIKQAYALLSLGYEVYT